VFIWRSQFGLLEHTRTESPISAGFFFFYLGVYTFWSMFKCISSSSLLIAFFFESSSTNGNLLASSPNTLASLATEKDRKTSEVVPARIGNLLCQIRGSPTPVNRVFLHCFVFDKRVPPTLITKEKVQHKGSHPAGGISCTAPYQSDSSPITD
jgi:hypothetical protein